MIEVDPRAREGIDALSKLISQVDKKTDGEEVISHLLSEIGSVRSLFECVSEDLISRHSVGKNAARALDLIDDLTRYTMREEMGTRPYIKTYADAAKYFRAVMFRRRIEYCYLMMLDARGRMLDCRLMQRGTVDRSAVYARQIAQTALRAQAVYCVLAHNHPGGTMEPSRGDVMVTHGVKDALNAVGILFLDHIIVSGHKSIGIRKMGMPAEKVWLNQKKGDKILENWLKEE